MKKRWFLLAALALVLMAAVVPAVRADGPDTRTARAEVRFLVDMIDHHQMALDMANDCLVKASTEDVRQICTAVIGKQTQEINEMRGWLLIWYGIDYRPMPMMHMMTMMQGGMMGQGMMGGMMGGMMQGGMMGGQQGDMMQATPQPPSTEHEQHHPDQGPGGAMTGTPMPGGPMSGTPVPGMMDGGMMGGMGGGMMQPDSWVMPMPMMSMMAGLYVLTGVDYDIAWLEAMIEHHDDALHMAERILNVTERPELRDLAERIISDQTAEIQTMEALIAELGGESAEAETDSSTSN